MDEMAGNSLEVTNGKKKFLCMSTRGMNPLRRILRSLTVAYNSLTEDQKRFIEQYAEIVHSDLTYIERVGGGSARCMLSELF